MSKYDISVIVPIYNAMPYLKQCVDSILAQTKSKIEIVLVDDGSTDGSASVVDYYDDHYENVVAVHQENGGVIKARVTGLKKATAPYIGWVDADDFAAPTMFEELYCIAIKFGADYVYCDYKFYPHKVSSKEKWFKKYNGVVDWMYIERNTQAWNTLTSRKLLDELDFTRLYREYGEYCWIAVLLNSKNTRVVEKSLYFYRVGNNTLSGGSFVGKTEKIYQSVRKARRLKRLIIGTPYEKTLKDYFDYRVIYTLIQLAIVSSINDDREKYNYAKRGLWKMKYLRNPLTKTILDYNHGKLKSLVLRYGIPSSYSVARIISKAAL